MNSYGSVQSSIFRRIASSTRSNAWQPLFFSKNKLSEQLVPARRIAHPRMKKKHLRTIVYNKEEVGEILVFHFPHPRVGVRQLSKTPTCTAHQTIVNPKFSAQSEPMVKSYDQNKFQAFSLKENDF